ncbi:MAG TPA: hypothetical protein VMR25_14465 [Planctomycetaceae bacterium]|jgi:hypothetical protein|nr:hypothetical protein [Planctomycetaceae bacterium]
MNRSSIATSELTVDRRRNGRRTTDGRKPSTTAASPTAAYSGADRRLKVERRRQIDPTTCERDYSEEQVEFMKAMDLYKRRSGRQFPTWSEVLEVLQNLGYRKVAAPTEMYQHAQPVQQP